MYIKEIELRNFKTFPREKIPLFNEFITISGPNGSGKSNIFDGITFGLGLDSSRMMRAEKLTDLIHKTNGGRRPDFAEVTIRLDNRDRLVPVDSNEITITRRVKENAPGNGKYYSTYYLNDRACNLSDIHMLLAKANISPGGHNIVRQGFITQIVDMNPIEKRQIIDEIAGVAEFDERKSKAMNELDAVKRKIEDTDLMLGMVEESLKQLQKDREQALKYEELKKEKIKNEGFLLLLQLQLLQRDLDENESKKKKMGDEREKLSKDAAGMETKIGALDIEVMKLEEEIKKKGGEEILNIRKNIESATEEIGKKKSFVELSKEKIDTADADRKRLLVEIDKKKDEIKVLEKKYEEEELSKQTFEDGLKDLRKSRDDIKKEMSEVGSKARERQARLEELKKLIEKTRGERSEIQLDIDRYVADSRRKSSDAEGAKNWIDGVEGQISQFEGSKKNKAWELEQLRAKTDSIEKEIAAAEKSRVQTDVRRAELNARLLELQRDYAKAEGLLKASEESKYSSGVNAILEAAKRKALQGIYGTIAELGKVDKKYALALEVAAGQRMEWLVADTHEDAANAIEYLKKMNAGRATCLPLNRIPKKNLPGTKLEKGMIDFAVNLIDYDPKFDVAFWYVLGDTLIVDSLGTALKYINKYRMATLEGDLLEKAGAMTGGSAPHSKRKFAQDGGRELTALAEQIVVQEAKLKECMEELGRIEASISALKGSISDVETEIKKGEMEIENLSSTIENMRLDVAKKKKELEGVKNEGDDVSQLIASLEKKREEKTKVLQHFENETAEIEKDIQASSVSSLVERSRDVEDNIRKYEDSVREVDGILAKQNLEIEHARGELKELGAALKNLERETKESSDKIVQYEKDVRELEKKIEEMKSREHSIDAELVSLRDLRERKVGKISDCRRELDQLRARHGQLGDEMSHLEYMHADLVSKLDVLKKDVADRNLTLDAGPIPSHDEIVKKIATVDEKMKSMEPINMKAIADYEAAASRRDKVKGQRDTLEKEHNEIIDRIAKCEQMKNDAFMEAFEGINKNFKQIFAELSDGFGELLLENPKNPFEGGLIIKAQPAGKMLLRIEARSGGEQSLIALSLLLAIQRYKPSPFYAFDEVDMHLDGINVERAARMIKECAKSAQFIVVSLREPMIEAADRIIGVAMQEHDVSTVTGIILNANGVKAHA